MVSREAWIDENPILLRGWMPCQVWNPNVARNSTSLVVTPRRTRLFTTRLLFFGRGGGLFFPSVKNGKFLRRSTVFFPTVFQALQRTGQGCVMDAAAGVVSRDRWRHTVVKAGYCYVLYECKRELLLCVTKLGSCDHRMIGRFEYQANNPHWGENMGKLFDLRR